LQWRKVSFASDHVDDNGDDDGFNDTRCEFGQFRKRLAVVWLHGRAREQRALRDRDHGGQRRPLTAATRAA